MGDICLVLIVWAGLLEMTIQQRESTITYTIGSHWKPCNLDSIKHCFWYLTESSWESNPKLDKDNVVGGIALENQLHTVFVI